MNIPIAMWTPSVWELGIVLVIVLVLFGAGKLPQVFGQLGKAVKSFRDGQAGATDDEPEDVTPPKELPASKVEDAHEVKSKAEA